MFFIYKFPQIFVIVKLKKADKSDSPFFKRFLQIETRISLNYYIKTHLFSCCIVFVAQYIDKIQTFWISKNSQASYQDYLLNKKVQFWFLNQLHQCIHISTDVFKKGLVDGTITKLYYGITLFKKNYCHIIIIPNINILN